MILSIPQAGYESGVGSGTLSAAHPPNIKTIKLTITINLTFFFILSFPYELTGNMKKMENGATSLMFNIEQTQFKGKGLLPPERSVIK